MVPLLAPIEEKTIWERTSGHWLKLAGLGLLATGLAMSVALKGGLKPSAPPLSARPVRMAVARIPPARVPPLLPTALEQPDASNAVAFREVADSQSPGSQQAPQACTNCWNKVHSGIDPGKEDSKNSLTTPWRPIKEDTDRAQFGLPYDPYGGPRMGDVPEAWQQCPQK